MDEQGVTAAEEFDGKDGDAVHYVVYLGDGPAGTARLRFPEDGVAKLERVAVREPFRGQGIGRELVERMEAEARERGKQRAVLHAQTAVEGFYRELGYETESGVFEEDGIPHVRMAKPLG